MFLGIDFGTSGVRAIAIADEIVAVTKSDYELSDIATWSEALMGVIGALPAWVRGNLQAIAIDGTSGTVLLANNLGQPICEPLLYGDSRPIIPELRAIIPRGHLTLSSTSSLTKLGWWLKNLNFTWADHYFLHQADWLSYLLHGQLGISDYHNALKLGYDVVQLCYPQWLWSQDFNLLLPRVYPAGQAIAPIQATVAQKLGINSTCQICAGTTDSTASFLATETNQVGQAVTSLGSTLVIKILNDLPIFDSKYGVYSHRLGDRWLVGGASNTGGAVLRQFFSDPELATLSQEILQFLSEGGNYPDPNYYPLLRPGERFPIYDPQLMPCLEPRSQDNHEFLYGLLRAIARIEAEGYQLLHQLGAIEPSEILTTGGGAQNILWQQIRQTYLKLPLRQAKQTEAAYGAALLAKANYRSSL